MDDKVYLIATYLASPIENIMILYFLIRNFGYRDEKCRRKIATVATFLIAVLMANLTPIVPNGDVIMSIAVIGVYWIYCIIAISGRYVMQLLCCLTAFIIIALSNSLSFQILSVIYDVDIQFIINENGILIVWIFVLSKVIFLICIEILLYVLKRNQINLRKKEWLTLVIVFIVSMIISYMVYTISVPFPSARASNLKFLIVLVGVFILNIYIYHSLIKLSRDNQRILTSRLADLQRQEMANQLLQISEADDNEAKLRHDWKNHFMCIQDLLSERKYEEAENYIQRINENYFGGLVTQKVCNNAVINSVVNNKIRMCQKMKILWEHNVTGDTSQLDGVTCSIVLFNLLDNAIEANADIENKRVTLTMYISKNYFHIIVKNPIKESVLESNPTMKSSKSKGRHGLGHINVEEVIKKNDGIVEYYETEGNFVAHVMIKT